MKERPIICKPHEVQGILAGRQTQIRRVVRNKHCSEDFHRASLQLGVAEALRIYPNSVKCPYGVPGDRLWVKETWATRARYDTLPPRYLAESAPLLYQSDNTVSCVMMVGAPSEFGKWRPSIHMPRWASRITLEVVSVRVERVQDISGADAKDEGISWDDGIEAGSYRKAFAALWDSINSKKHPWSDNPWVWAGEFKVLAPAGQNRRVK